jgi:hypothetical protein
MMTRTSVLLAAILAFSAENVKAVVVDSFDDANRLYLVSRLDRRQSDQTRPGSDAAIGGYRDVALQWISGDKSYVELFDNGKTPGLVFDQRVTEAKATLTWDGANSPGQRSYLLDADLTLGGHDDFLFDIGKVTGSGIGLKMTVYTDAAYASQYIVVVPAGTSGEFKLPYADFMSVGLGGAADFANVGAIVLELNGMGHADSDIVIRSIVTSAPEPSTLVMAAIGAVAFFGLRRRRRRA